MILSVSQLTMRENTAIERILTFLDGEFTPKYGKSEMVESSQSVWRGNQVCWQINPVFIKSISFFQTQKQAKKKNPILSKRETTIHVWIFILKFILH